MLTKPFTDRELMDIVFTQLKICDLNQERNDHLINLALFLLPT